MLQKDTIKFLTSLKKNNTKEWFDVNRKIYETAKQDFTGFVADIINGFGKKDETIAHLQPKDCMFRINRDVRFSKDKSPYKTNFGASFSKGGKKSLLAGYYFHLEPGNCFMGGGIYMPDAETTKKVRQEIDYGFDEFKKIIQNKKFVTQYGSLTINEEFSLTREPKGYDKDNPAIEYIKLKSWLATCQIPDGLLTDKALTNKVVAAFEALLPLMNFLNKALE